MAQGIVMANNNAHNETRAARLARFQSNPPYEAVATLLNSIANFFNNELSLTVEGQNDQTSLMFLGVHASALTIMEALFDVYGPDAYRLFLEKFVDGAIPDRKFSAIAGSIHAWRNILAHQWLGSAGHLIGYDYQMNLGWEDRGGTIFINPAIYLECYLAAFRAGGAIWQWEAHLSAVDQEAAKQRIIDKYIRN